MTQMTRWRAMVGVLVLTAGLAACADDDKTPTAPTPAPAPAPPPPAPAAPTTASLTGTVSNVTGARIAGAKVTILDGPDAGLSIETNANGDFRFGSLSIGNANFSATSGGYQEVRAGTHVDGTNTLSFVFTHASLTGTVSNTDGGRLGGARVTVLDGPNAGQSVQADAGGVYRFEALNVANGNLVAMADRHDEDRRGTFINGTNTLNFTLVAHPPPAEGGGGGPSDPGAPAITITTRIVIGGPGAATQEWELVAESNVELLSDSYNWSFGDGAGASNTGRVERHVYRRGSYTVEVSATRPNGQRISGELSIEVN